MIRRTLVGAFLVFVAFGPDAQVATAGTAVAPFEVRAQVVPIGGSQCRAIANPVSLACGSPQTPTILQPRPDLVGTLADGWLTYGNRTEAYDSVYAASLTTRLVRYEQWEYIETLVSW